MTAGPPDDQFARLYAELDDSHRELSKLMPRAQLLFPGQPLHARPMSKEDLDDWQRASERYRAANQAMIDFLRDLGQRA